MLRNPFDISLKAAALCGSLALCVGFVGCGGQETPPPEYPPIEVPETAAVEKQPSVDPALSEKPEASPPKPVAPPVKVTMGDSTPLEGKAPVVKIATPKSGQLIKTGDVKVKITAQNWKTEKDGAHIHLVLDNEPYIPLFDIKAPVNLNQAVKENLGKELTPGTHVLRVFPGRAHHESVKDEKAFAVTVFHVGEKTADFQFDAKAPLLTYSRPKGCVAIGERALLDFYVSNATLAADGHKVRYVIDGAVEGMITDWKPHFIENLTAGQHDVRLTLLDKEGKPVPGAFNDTTHSFSVMQVCEMPPAPPSTTGDAPAGAKPEAAAEGEKAVKKAKKVKPEAETPTPAP